MLLVSYFEIKRFQKICFLNMYSLISAELEKLGPKYRVALRIAQQLERLPCQHKGTYADDCLVNRIKAHKVCTYAVITLFRKCIES